MQELNSSIDYFGDYLKSFGLKLGGTFTVKEIIFNIQKRNGNLKTIVGFKAPPGFDFLNESLYADPALKRVFSNILFEHEILTDFNQIIDHFHLNFTIQNCELEVGVEKNEVEIRIFGQLESQFEETEIRFSHS